MYWYYPINELGIVKEKVICSPIYMQNIELLLLHQFMELKICYCRKSVIALLLELRSPIQNA